MTKKTTIIFVITTILLSLVINVSAETSQYILGGYYQLGTYNEQPIIWRCVSTNDENGILMVSDKIISFKSANLENNNNSHYEADWKTSDIRKWLNSGTQANEIINLLYSEPGFLSEQNFKESEKDVIKTISQWQPLTIDKVNLSENGITKPYITEFSRIKGHGDTELLGCIELSELRSAYKGAISRVTDTIFLLDELQIDSIINNLGTLKANSIFNPTNKVESLSSDGCYEYYLRTPCNLIGSENTLRFNSVYKDEYPILSNLSTYKLGIRPGFYLNESIAQIKSGSGTEKDPYILDGTPQDGITVYSNGEQLNFEQQPLIENDHTLVGMRAVFESLGADVSWTGENKTVTAVKDDTTIQLQIDNNIMKVNNDTVELETPARLVNDNTMVPVRAVSEALDARVEWIEDLQRVVVDEQPEWVESDWNPDWYQQAMKAGGYTR